MSLLVLAWISAASAAGARASLAVQEARARPFYERALAAYERSRSPGSRQALAELQALADELEGQTYGLEDPLDPDRVLASTITLCALAARPERAEALRGILVEVEGHLRAGERDDPDLALALAQGWPALLTVQTGKALPLEERVAGLTFALESAHAIDAADQRDLLGIRLAEDLHAQLSVAGPPERATQALEHWLARFPDDLVRRPFLLGAAADERRLQHSWNFAWRDLKLAEEALARVLAQPDAHAPVLRRTLASERCQLEFACGLVDQAMASVEREREAVRDGADDTVSLFSLQLDVSTVALVSDQPAVLSRARAELEGALADPQRFADHPEYRAQLRARLAVVEELWEEAEPARERSAPRLLEDALAQPGLGDVDRAMLVLRLTRLAHRSGEPEAAARWLARLDPREDTEAPRLPPEYEVAATAWRARLALARGAERAELERHDSDVRACYEGFLSSWASRPERAGGVGPLVLESRRLLLGVLVDLCLALGDENKEEDAIDLLLREQAVGSLARRFSAPSGSVAEVRSRLLRSDVGMLLYLPSDLFTHLFCIDGERIEHVQLPWRYGHEPSLQALTRLLASSPARLSDEERAAQQLEIEAHSKELTERLLPRSVQGRLATWKGAYVVGAELLGGVPFECLRVGATELGTTVALAYLPSIPVGLVLAQKKSDPPRRELGLLLVAAPEIEPRSVQIEPKPAQIEPKPSQIERSLLAGTPPALPFGKAEEDVLTAGYRRATVLAGPRATFTGLVEALQRDEPRVLHFLVHGVTDLERELSGGLALAPCAGHADGRLWCEDILEGAFRSPELVLLSACGSARGPRRPGDDGLAQLGGAFLARGALCTVQATNDIAFAATVRMMGAFGRGLAAGESPAEALRAARAELVRETNLSHPFYAQALRVVGLGLEPMLP